MRIAYVEDDIIQCERMSRQLKNCFSDISIPVDCLDVFTTTEKFMEDWYTRKYDLIVLDIFLDESSGIELAQEIRKTDKDVFLIFCSTSNDFASESYQVQASYYLTKPISYNKMSQMAGHIAKAMKMDKEYLELKNGQKILISQIISTEYYNHCININLKDDLKVKVYASQKSFLETIQKYDYLLPINQGTVINLKEVVSYSNKCFTMSDRTMLHVSRRKAAEVQERYQNYVFNDIRG